MECKKLQNEQILKVISSFVINYFTFIVPHKKVDPNKKA